VFLLELLTSPVGFRKLFTRAEREVIILWWLVFTQFL
jgi:hypothetical protein